MKVIFLDIDGVLNGDHTTDRAPSGVIGIEDEKVALLADIVRQTGAVIVLTSSWKPEWNQDASLCTNDGLYINEKFAKAGLSVLDKTKDGVIDRGAGIRTWLRKHSDVDGWAAIDDDIFADFRTFGVMPHLVKTKWQDHGLKKEHVSLAIEILNTKGL